MNFVDLKKRIKEKQNNIYYIYGEDSFLKNNAFNIISSHFNVDNKEMNELSFSSEDLTAQKVLDACNTMPFFSEYKLVVVKDNGGKIEENFVKRMGEYIKNPVESTILIFIAGANNLFLPLQKMCEVVDCSKLDSQMLSKWIDNELLKNNKTIKLEAKQQLIEWCNYDLMKISTELQKITDYVLGKSVIEKQDVETLTVKDLEFQVYEFTNAIGDKKAEKALLLAKRMIEHKDAVHSVLGLLLTYFRRMFHVSVSNNSNEQLSQELGVKEYAIKMAKQVAQKFGQVKLKKINDLCVETDYQIKSGNLNLENGLYLLIYKILEA